MRILKGIVIAGGLSGAAVMAWAQRPGPGPGGLPPGGGFGEAVSKSADVDDLVSRMMAFDKDMDGTLAESEVTDERLLRLFRRADADKDGKVTRAELTALGETEHVEGRGGPGGPGGFGPPGGGPGGPGMFRPGEVLPPMLRDRLELTAEQEKEVDALQKDVDARLVKILSAEQNAQIKEMRERGPGRFGPPGGPGGPGGGRGGRGGPGGPPPGVRPE